MSDVLELFGNPTADKQLDWQSILTDQCCIFTNKTCYKVRKSDPGISIGTCTVLYGKTPEAVIICPIRLIQKRQIFTDCLHLLTTHEPGNELHIVPEVSIPGGSVDYFLVSAKSGRVKDFVGIELQTLDTTGTVWPERQRFLMEIGLPGNDRAEESDKKFGMNWKMTAKTILVQMHHKAQTFEHVNKKLVLVNQDKLLEYMRREFQFNHLNTPARLGDSVHLHAYNIVRSETGSYNLDLAERISTDAEGIATCLGLQAEARIELEQIIQTLQAKISEHTRFNPV